MVEGVVVQQTWQGGEQSGPGGSYLTTTSMDSALSHSVASEDSDNELLTPVAR